MPPFALDPTDIRIMLAVVAGGLVILRMAYWKADKFWEKRHGITVRYCGQERKVSGYWAEALFTLCGLLIFLGVDGLTPDIRLWRLVGDHPAVSAFAVALALAIYTQYARSVFHEEDAGDGPKSSDHHRRVRQTYIIYAPYALAIYILSAVAVAMLALQYLHNAALIAGHRGEILARLNELAAYKSPEAIQAGIELSYGDIVETGNAVAAIMAPTILTIAAVLAMVLLATATPLKVVLRENSRNVTRYSGYIIAALIFALALGTYYFSYAGLLADSLQAISNVSPALVHEHASWQILERFNDVVLDLKHKETFFGFLIMMANESGVAVIAVAFFEWLATEFHPSKHYRPEH